MATEPVLRAAIVSPPVGPTISAKVVKNNQRLIKQLERDAEDIRLLTIEMLRVQVRFNRSINRFMVSSRHSTR